MQAVKSFFKGKNPCFSKVSSPIQTSFTMLETELFFGPVAITVVIGVTTIFLLYWYSIRNHDYWKKRGIPSVKTVPFFGSVLAGFKEPLQDVEERRYKELGHIYGHFEGDKALLSVADPTLLRDILVKDFSVFHDRRTFKTGDKIFESMLSVVTGDDWKRIRTIVSPTFSTGKIKRMLSIFKDCSSTLVENFKAASESGKYIDAKRLYGTFTMDIIASSAFSTKIDSHNNPENNFVRMARKVFSQSVNWRFLIFFVFPQLLKVMRISVFDKEAMTFFTSATLEIMEERKRTGQVRNDFLQLLMETAKEVSEEQKVDSANKESGDIAANYGQEDVNPTIFKTVTSKQLSMTELVAQCVIFFIAGYDTTASTLSFATYCLALNPEIQDKVRKEVNEVLKETDGDLTYDAIQNMKYLDNVIAETLRMYPPLARMERVATTDYKLGDTGILITKEMTVTIPVYAMHRDPALYPEPEKFDPDRFTAEERAKRDPYVYLPFGAGPRNCVAMRFALLEVKVCLAQVIANFNIKRCPQTKVPLEFKPGQGLMQPKEIILEMEIRKDSPLIK